jgi:hypothetical protein
LIKAAASRIEHYNHPGRRQGTSIGAKTSNATKWEYTVATWEGRRICFFFSTVRKVYGIVKAAASSGCLRE